MLTTILEHKFNLDLLNENSIIVDAGAAYGDFVEEIRKIDKLKNTKIYCIECGETNFKELKEKNFENVILINKVLVGENCKDQAEFFDFQRSINKKISLWGNLYGYYVDSAKGRGDCGGIKHYMVNTLRFNSIFETYFIDKIDYLKMDVEGTETGIINTMTKENANRITQISFEYHEDADPEVLSKKLNELGFDTEHFRELREIYACRRNS